MKKIKIAIQIIVMLSGGEAVYSARVMLGLMIDDDCSNSSRFSDPNVNENAYTEEQLIEVYPNPANEELNIAGELPEGRNELIIYGLTGSEVKHFVLAEGVYLRSFAISDIEQGAYIYVVVNDQTKIKTGKIIIIR